MLKPGAFALKPGCVENVPGPVQTFKFARILGSVISIGLLRSAPWIVILRRNNLLSIFASHADIGQVSMGPGIEGDLTHYVKSNFGTDASRPVFPVPINISGQNTFSLLC